MLRRVGILAADSMLGRDAGQIGNVRATNYVERELQRLGLKPAGEQGYFQTISLVARGPVKAATMTVDGTALAPTDFQSVRAAGGAPFGGVFDRTNVATVYGGRIGGTLIDPARVRGKVVVFSLDVPGNAPIAAYAGQNGILAPFVDAAAILISPLDKMSTQMLGGQQFSRIVLDDVTARVVPAAVISIKALKTIFGIETALEPGVAGKPVSGRFGMENSKLPAPARNVIAILPGTDARLRGEYVAIGAHTDHVGVGRPVDHDSVRAANAVLRPLGANGQPRQATQSDVDRINQIRAQMAKDHAPRLDSIFNGADDDASGTAVALELAEYFVKHPPRRSLLFVFHTAEEKGLFGAEYFTEHPTVNRDAIVMALNMDQVSRGGPEDVAGSQPNTVYLLGSRRLSTGLGDLVEKINSEPGHNLNLDYSLDAPGHPSNGYCRSDHYMYARYGIPIVFMSAGWHRDYHMVTDEVQYIQPNVMMGIGTLARDLIASVANADQKPLVDQPKPDPNGVCRQ
jgi:hypothetical protein